MKTISLQARFAKLTRQRDQLRDRRVTTMKAGIEAGHLRHVGQSLEDRFDGCQVVRLMQAEPEEPVAYSSARTCRVTIVGPVNRAPP